MSYSFTFDMFLANNKQLGGNCPYASEITDMVEKSLEDLHTLTSRRYKLGNLKKGIEQLNYSLLYSFQIDVQ